MIAKIEKVIVKEKRYLRIYTYTYYICNGKSYYNGLVSLKRSLRAKGYTEFDIWKVTISKRNY